LEQRHEEYNTLNLKFAFNKHFYPENRKKRDCSVMSSSGVCLAIQKIQKLAHYEYQAALSSI